MVKLTPEEKSFRLALSYGMGVDAMKKSFENYDELKKRFVKPPIEKKTVGHIIALDRKINSVTSYIKIYSKPNYYKVVHIDTVGKTFRLLGLDGVFQNTEMEKSRWRYFCS